MIIQAFKELFNKPIAFGTVISVERDKVCIIGNVDPVGTILRGTIEDIHNAGKLCISIAYDNPKGFILSTGCDTSIVTHPDNIIALMDSARMYGQIS